MKGYEVCYWTTGKDYTKKEYEYLNNAVEDGEAAVIFSGVIKRVTISHPLWNHYMECIKIPGDDEPEWHLI